MMQAIALLLVLLATVSDVRAGERRRAAEHLHLPAPELFGLFAAPASNEWRVFADVATPEDLTASASGLPPLLTLLAPTRAAGRDGRDTTPLLAFGARVQGCTLVAFTRPGARTDPDDRVVYQRLVASDLLEGRRFSVTVYEDHALGPSSTQMLGFGARLMLRPAIDIYGWRTRIEIFASYDMTQAATGYVALVAIPPSLPSPRRLY